MNTNQPNSSSSRSSVARNVVVVLILMISTALITYYFVRQIDKKEQEVVVAEKDTEIQDVSDKMTMLTKRLDAKIKESRRLGADYKALEEYKEQLEMDIADLQQKTEMSAVQLQQYTAKIQAFERMLDAKDKELAELREQNERLNKQNVTISSQRDSLIRSKEELEMVLGEKEETNRTLASAASILNVATMDIVAMNRKDKKESRNTFRRKRIDKLRIDFTLAANSVADAGNRTVYMRLVEPSGSIIYNAAAGSGSFEAQDGQSKFTQKTQLFYNNTSTPATINFDRPGDYDFKSGRYKVELYADGHQIGYKSFEVK